MHRWCQLQKITAEPWAQASASLKELRRAETGLFTDVGLPSPPHRPQEVPVWAEDAFAAYYLSNAFLLSPGLPEPLGIWGFYRIYGLGVVLQGNLKPELISFQGVRHNAILVFLESVSLRKGRGGQRG